jgi:PIN domain-containing protein
VSLTLVLDTSFVRAYTHGSLAAGELLHMVTDDGDTALMPAAALAEAHALAKPHEIALLRILAETVECLAIAPLTADQAEDVGAFAKKVSWGDAHTAYLARAHDVHVATADRGRIAAALPPGWSFIEI